MTEAYFEAVSLRLAGLPNSEREELLQRARAELDLTLELEHASPHDEAAVARALERMGSPADLAGRLKPGYAPPVVSDNAKPQLTTCRACAQPVSREAFSCPHCGAPFPTRTHYTGTGYEWKSKKELFGWPLVHVAYGRTAEGKLRVAKGVIAIGQFGIGAITIAQFGIGLIFGLGQFVLAPLAVAQFAMGLVAIGQFAFGLIYALGMIAIGSIADGFITWGNWLRGLPTK